MELKRSERENYLNYKNMIDLIKTSDKKLILYHKELYDIIYGKEANYRIKDLIFMDQIRDELTRRGYESYKKIDWKKKMDEE